MLDWLHAEYPELVGYGPRVRLRIVVKRDGARERFDRKKLGAVDRLPVRGTRLAPRPTSSAAR